MWSKWSKSESWRVSKTDPKSAKCFRGKVQARYLDNTAQRVGIIGDSCASHANSQAWYLLGYTRNASS